MPDNRKGFASALHIRGLRQRWMFSAVLPILLLLVLAVALFSVGVQEYYYNAMRSGLESRARIAAETFTGYGVKSYSEYSRRTPPKRLKKRTRSSSSSSTRTDACRSRPTG